MAKVQRENGVATVDLGHKNLLVCFSCTKEGALELDKRTTPPELVCGKCRRKALCDRCHKRVHSLVFQPDGKFLCSKCDRPRRQA